MGVWNSVSARQRVPTLLWTSPHVPFPLADFALYPFAVINCNCEYDYMLSPSSESLGVVWVPPAQLFAS